MLNLEEESILLDMQARYKEGALRELADVLHGQFPLLEAEAYCNILREREQIGSTGVGNGIALPHGKLAGLDRIRCGFGRSINGIGFEAVDNQPVHFFFVMLAPLDIAHQYLHTLAGASRLLKQPEIRKKLRQADTAAEIVNIFKASLP